MNTSPELSASSRQTVLHVIRVQTISKQVYLSKLLQETLKQRILAAYKKIIYYEIMSFTVMRTTIHNT
jgi:hypothetical protein